MNILINASNLSGGGGAQVADSICRYLHYYSKHKFVVVLSKRVEYIAKDIKGDSNVKIERYSCKPGDIKALITFRNQFLDMCVEKYNIDCVYSVFGPMKWRPRCIHISGFGLSHIVMPESPFFQEMSILSRLKWGKTIKIWKYVFRRSTDILVTENPLISNRLQAMMKNKRVITVTNNYNQIFDNPYRQRYRKLPLFEGITFLDVTAFGPHKNTTIALEIARIFKRDYPNFKCRFVFTFDKEKYPVIPQDLTQYFYFTGKVDIEECPSLYDQCDIEFQPTLLECFTATYPEAMRMGRPIVTVDLPFAHGLCGEAAIYFSPLSPISAAKSLYRVATDMNLRQTLVEAGRKQLLKFDTSKERADKIINLCEISAGTR